MKSHALSSFRQNLRGSAPLYGLWITLESPAITEMAVALGLDWVVIDAEHGQLDWKEIAEHLRATVRSQTVALVRIAELNGSLIKRVLDLGADGVVIPWVETADQLRQAVAWARYPTEGLRGIGAERATVWGHCLGEHVAEANQQVLVVPIIETIRTAREVPAMCAVDGVDLFWFGPADYSSTAGYRGQWEGPGIAEQILHLKDTIQNAGKQCGVLATNAENLAQRRAQGFRCLGLGMDASLLLRTLQTSLAVAGRPTVLHTSFCPDPQPVPESARLARPAESFRPDRPEIMNAQGAGPVTTIAPGVEFECQVGSHNQARALTTGLVTVAPQAELPAHTHSFAESLTLLQGELTIDVEGRTYQLGRLDNIVIPAGRVHRVWNSTAAPTRLHIAMATDTPSRSLVDTQFTSVPMPVGSPGCAGAERVTWYRLAPRTAAGPNTEFIDAFNADLMPGLTISGGYGLFFPGGRLPAHVHDFDESICIISGQATCLVEGRRYLMQDCATALQPRGRIHYFINESNAPMEMLWVYAGPRPERILVDESCATEEGNPWLSHPSSASV